MDVSSAQAPPAVIQGTQQEAVAALGRLIATQQWITEQENALPALPATATMSGRHAFQQQQLAFWDASIVPAPGASRACRWATFGERMLGVMRDEATLRRLDGTLSERAYTLIDTFTRARGHASSPSIHARELTFADAAYAGAVVLDDESMPGLALLFMPGRGWEEFTDRGALHRSVEGNVRADLAEGTPLSGIMIDEFHAAIDAPFVDSRDVTGPFAERLVQRVIALQRERIHAAWPGVGAAPDDDKANTYLLDHVAPLRRLHPYLNIHDLIAARTIRLVNALNRERLEHVPDDVAADWQAARNAYVTATRVAARQRIDSDLTEPTTLEAFVHDGLASRLKARGITTDPDDVIVDVHDFTRAYFHNPTGRVDAAYLGPVRQSLSLAQVALRNEGFLDNNVLMARRRDGTTLGTLPAGAIKPMVREFNLAAAYASYLMRTLGTSPEGQLSRAVTNTVAKARMRFDAEDARLGYYIPHEPRSFVDDHAFRGYAWVDAVLDAPSSVGRRRVDGHEIVVRQLYYKGAALNDVLAIGVRDERSVQRVVLYTPDAPDGISFREFNSRSEAERGFLSQPAFESYLLDRLPADVARLTANGAERHFDLSEGEQRFRWAFTVGDTASIQKTHPFEDRVVERNFFDASYDGALSQVARNVHASARSTTDADVDNLPLLVDPGVVGRGVAGLLGRPFQASWRAYDRIKAGDHATAFIASVDAYVASLDFLAMGAMRPIFMRALAVRASAGSRQIVPAGKLPDPITQFDERFVAQGVSIRQADSVTNGIYTLGNRRYIEQGGKMYGVRRESGTWRLSHPDSATYAPHVKRNAQGGWEYLGLDGGLDPRPFVWATPPDRAALFGLSFHQRRVFEQTLIARTGMREARNIVRRTGRSSLEELTAALTPAQENHWRAAFRAAADAPAQRIPLVAPMAAPVVAPPAANPLAPAAAAAGAAGPAPANWRPPSILQELLPEQWPATLWHYPSRREFMPMNTPRNLVLPQSAHNAAGVTGLGAVSVNPLAPWATLNGTLGGPTLSLGPTHGAYEWISINLTALRARVDAFGHRVFRVFRVRNGSNVNYLIRETVPTEGTIWLRHGEFNSGLRIVPLPDLDGAMPGPSRPPAN
jgi:hypothetical protein